MSGKYSPNNPFAPKADFSDVESGHSSSAPKKEYSANNPFAKKKKSQAGGFLAPIAQGLTLGAADEILGGIEGLSNLGEEGGFSAGYERGKQKVRAVGQEFKEEHPVASPLLEIGAGLAAPGFGAAKFVGKGAGALAKIGRGATAGAALGAGSGAAYSDEGSRTGGAIAGGTTGALLGGALPAVGMAGGQILNQLGMRTARGAEKVGTQKVIQALARDEITPQMLRDAAAGVGDKPAILADLGGSNLTGLGRAAQAVPSKAKNQLAETLYGRQEGQLGRIAGDVEETLGLKGRDVFDVAEELVSKRRENAAPLYEAAYQKGVIDSDGVRELLKRPAMKKALQSAKITAKDEGTALPDGMLDVRTIDYMKRSLDDRISALTRKGANDKARVLRSLRDKMLDEVDNAVPEFKAARQQFAGDSQLMEALDAGQNFLKADSRIIGKTIPRFTEGEQEMYRIGALDAIRKVMDGSPDNIDKVKKIFGSPEARNRLKELLGDPERFAELEKRMALEGKFVRTKEGVLGNSVTLRAQAELADMANTAIDAALNMASGNVGGALKTGFKAAISGRAKTGSSKIAEIIAQKLQLKPGTPEFDAFVSQLESKASARPRPILSLPRRQPVP